MKQFENYDDDNLEQVGTDSFVVNYEGVSVGHLDTTIDGKHIVIDTVLHHDTVYVEKHTYDKEIQIIEKLINRPDFGKSAASILIVLFVCYSIWKKWNCNKK